MRFFFLALTLSSLSLHAKEPPLTTQTGLAAWFGREVTKTSSGERNDPSSMTAAHRTLPFGTRVQVRNLKNGCTAIVRIIDRGPFIRGRIIDLSMAAARQLDMVRTGTARVQLKVIPAPVNRPSMSQPPVNPLVNPPAVTDLYAVQAGAFSDPSRAEALRERLSYLDPRVVERKSNPSIWRVLIGHALTIQEATALAADVEKTTGQAIVVKE